MIPENAPKWLKYADTRDADVVVLNGVVQWRGGVWLGGVWLGGVWRGGVWLGGVWRGGVWRGGEWLGGEWLGGVWRGGVWLGGVWLDKTTDGLRLRLSLLGMVPDKDGYMVGYRCVNADLSGKHTHGFVQREGRVDVVYAPAGSGTCRPGLHVTTAGRAWSYFGVDRTARLFRARFTMDDVLDCDGEKVRLKGADCEEIAWPFVREQDGGGA